MVDAFVGAMLDKLRRKQLDGWVGWDDSKEYPDGVFHTRLLSHLSRAMNGDAAQWVHVANFAMFCWWRAKTGERDAADRR